MNPTQAAQSEALQVAQIAADTTSQLLNAGLTGITLFALIIAFALIILMFALLWFLLRRSGAEKDLLKQASETNGQLLIELRKENENAQSSREKQVEATYRQADSNETLNQTMRVFIEKQSLQGDTLDRMDVNILSVVNGFGNLDESIRRIESAVKNNPGDHRQVLEALNNLATAQDKIFNLIDSRLPESAKTATPRPAAPPGSFPMEKDASMLVAQAKRQTDKFPAVKPDDKPDDAA